MTDNTAKAINIYRIGAIAVTLLLVILVFAGSVQTGFAWEKAEQAAEHKIISIADIDYSEAPEISGTSAIVMDAGSGEILYEKDAQTKRDPASITKILNCLVCLDTLDFDEEITVDIDPETEGSIIGLKRGEKIKVKDLVYGMMLASGNDAAEVLGYLAGGDIETFCGMMNDKAKECGAKDTEYCNPNGLNEETVNNVTTAYDIAMVVKYAMKDKRFRKIVGTAKYTIEATNKSKARKLKNSDRCLWDTKTKVKIDGKDTPMKYKGCKGVKTGYSSTAGDCFAGFAKRGNTEIITVVLNAVHEAEKFQDTINLWNYAYDRFETYTACRTGNLVYKQKIKRGSLREVDLGLESDLDVTVNKGYDASETVTTQVELYDAKPTAPVKKGDVMGKLVAYSENGSVCAEQNLISLETAEEGGPLSYIGIADEDIWIFIVGMTALAIAVVALVIRKPWIKRKHV